MSERHLRGARSMLRRRHMNGFAIPLMAWILCTGGIVRLELGWTGFLASALLDFPAIVLAMLVTAPVARMSFEASAAFQGRPVEQLEPGASWRWFLGLAEREPAGVVWAVSAMWWVFPVLVGGVLVLFSPFAAGEGPAPVVIAGVLAVLPVLLAVAWAWPARRLFGGAGDAGAGALEARENGRSVACARQHARAARIRS